jgi:fructose-1,6-bisphosphatase/inositol monophosphatase family enzyme
MSHPSVFLQVMSVAVKATDHAGQLIRDIMMKGSDLGIVQKTGEKDLQTLADRTANDCIVGSLKKVFKLYNLGLLYKEIEKLDFIVRHFQIYL